MMAPRSLITVAIPGSRWAGIEGGGPGGGGGDRSGASRGGRRAGSGVQTCLA